jgi:uncharacterized membrane protein YsdA (DUF1294 family)
MNELVVAMVLGIYYLAINVITFIIYARDKSAAGNGDWRTSEATLHAFRFFNL